MALRFVVRDQYALEDRSAVGRFVFIVSPNAGGVVDL
jgi:hypothetical protein